MTCGYRLKSDSNAGTQEEEQGQNHSQRFEKVCQTLVAQLDGVRAKRFQLVKELISDYLPDGRSGILNDSFSEGNIVRMSEQDTPTSYEFNTVAGDTVEAAIICWQLHNAVAFAMQEKMYFKNDELNDFTDAVVVAIKNNSRWAVSLGGLYSPGGPIDDDGVASVLGHYLIGDPTKSFKVSLACQVLRERGMPFLRALTYLGTATAFGDEKTVHGLMAKMRS
jgi:hypothetical protein